MKKILSVLCAVFLFGCNQTDITGNWTQPVNGMENMYQGITFSDNGVASSINMATLQYNTWRRDGDSLIVTGKSIGNGQIIDFTETWQIEKLTKDTLIVNINGQSITYSRAE